MLKAKLFSESSSLNLTIPKNKVIAFPNIENTPYAGGFNGVIVGQPLGVAKVYHLLGMDPATGEYVYSDALTKILLHFRVISI